MARLIRVISFLCILSSASFSYVRFAGYCPQAGSAKGPSAQPGPTGAKVTVYMAGTHTKAEIYEDNDGTAKSNPLICGKAGYFFFYSADGKYDLTFNGDGAPSTLTWSAETSADLLNTPYVISDYYYKQKGLTLKKACDDAQSTPGAPRTLTVSSKWTGLGTQTVSCLMDFSAGGSVQPAAGQTITFNVFPHCPVSHQCFDTSLGGAGSIVFASIIPPLSAEWFGAEAQHTGQSTSGVTNSVAFAAAQRALPAWPSRNPQGVPMNLGKITLGTAGIEHGFALAETFHLSPRVTLAGMETAATVIFPGPTNFKGSYMVDTINSNGDRQPPNNNFTTAITNIYFEATGVLPPSSTVGCVNWLASLRSHLDRILCATRGIGFLMGNLGQGIDGTSGADDEVDIYPTGGATALTGQGMVWPQGNGESMTNVFSNLKFVYGGAYGPPGPLYPGYLPCWNQTLEIGPGVSSLHLRGLNFENLPCPISIAEGSNNIRIEGVSEFADCTNDCVQSDFICANLIDPNTYNIHIEGTVKHFRFAVCLGSHWETSREYRSGQTIVDPRGNIQRVTVAGTSGKIQPAWNASPGKTTAEEKGTLTWTNEGALSETCQLHKQTGAREADISGYEPINCALHTINGKLGPLRGTLTGPLGASSGADNTTYSFVYDSNTFFSAPPL